jgi:LPXTG-motif cell wall-anchored protein
LALTIGVVVGLFASIVLAQTNDRDSMIALWVGIGGGVVAAVVLWIRAVRSRKV